MNMILFKSNILYFFIICIVIISISGCSTYGKPVISYPGYIDHSSPGSSNNKIPNGLIDNQKQI
jgi:uncharacterized protein YceK